MRPTRGRGISWRAAIAGHRRRHQPGRDAVLGKALRVRRQFEARHGRPPTDTLEPQEALVRLNLADILGFPDARSSPDLASDPSSFVG